MEDAPDLYWLSVLPAALAAAVEWLLSSVHSDVHFKYSERDAFVDGETAFAMGVSRSIHDTIHVK
jgi:hypothetical protein